MFGLGFLSGALKGVKSAIQTGKAMKGLKGALAKIKALKPSDDADTADPADPNERPYDGTIVKDTVGNFNMGTLESVAVHAAKPKPPKIPTWLLPLVLIVAGLVVLKKLLD